MEINDPTKYVVAGLGLAASLLFLPGAITGLGILMTAKAIQHIQNEENEKQRLINQSNKDK